MATQLDTQLLYITYFGRPADPSGLTYWTTGAPGTLPLDQVADYFAADVEFAQTTAGKTTAQIVNSFYINAFGRDSDASGLAYWVGKVQNGEISIQDVGLFIAKGALEQPPGSPDRVIMESKQAASQNWTAQVGANSTSTAQYNGSLANAYGVKFLQGVINTVPTTTATQNAINNLPPVGLDWLTGTKWVYVDFDGHTPGADEPVVNSYRFSASSANYTAAQRREFLETINNFYSPFNVRFTDDPTRYANSGAYVGRIVVGTNLQVSANGDPFVSLSNFGGTAFANGSSVFTNKVLAGVDVTNLAGPRAAGALAAHEFGHSCGLQHPLLVSDVPSIPGVTRRQDYNGHVVVNSIDRWNSLMGNITGFNPNSYWQLEKGDFRAPITDLNGVTKVGTSGNPVDQVALLGNLFGFRPDDVADTITGAPTKTLSSTGQTYGLINNRNDVDVYKFTHGGGSLNLTVDPAVVHYEVGSPLAQRTDSSWHPLNIKADLLNSSGAVVSSSDPQTSKSASISGTFAAGTYYLRVDGVGQGAFNNTPYSNGFDDYGSIGLYAVSGLG